MYHAHTDVDMCTACSSLYLLSFGRRRGGNILRSMCRVMGILSFPVLNGQFVKMYHAHTDVDMCTACSSLCLLSFGGRRGGNILRSMCRVMGILLCHLLHFHG